jgi:hypothetical protein
MPALAKLQKVTAMHALPSARAGEALAFTRRRAFSVFLLRSLASRVAGSFAIDSRRAYVRLLTGNTLVFFSSSRTLSLSSRTHELTLLRGVSQPNQPSRAEKEMRI